MKKLILLLAIVIGLFSGCHPIDPRADFEVSNTTVYPYEDIQFYNRSTHAYDFEWDFDDGTFSNLENPVHSYARPGTYRVRLSAFDHDQEDYAEMTIYVVDPPEATLKVSVLEYYQKYPIEDALVILYPTEKDWWDRTNKVIQVLTDKYGIAVISGLTPGYYYLDVSDAHHDNYDLAKDDINFIKTKYLVNYATTYFTAYVDYFSTRTQNTLKSTSDSSRRNTTLKTSTHRVYSEKLNTKK